MKQIQEAKIVIISNDVIKLAKETELPENNIDVVNDRSYYWTSF